MYLIYSIGIQSSTKDNKETTRSTKLLKVDDEKHSTVLRNRRIIVDLLFRVHICFVKTF